MKASSEPQNHLLQRRNIWSVWCNKCSWIYLLRNRKKERKMNATGKGMIAFWLHKKGEHWSVKSVDKENNPEV